MQVNENDTKIAPDVSAVPEVGWVLSGRIARNPDVSCRIENDEYALLYNPDTDNTAIIDRSGLLIWNYIEESRSISDIMAYMTTCFSGSPDPVILRKDIEIYLYNLMPEFAVENI